MTSLYLILLAHLVTPRGNPLPHLREQPASYLRDVAADIERASDAVGVPRALFAALIIAESNVNRDAISFNGTSLGLAQLNVRGPWYRMWQRACHAVPSECQYSGLVAGAYALRGAIIKCRGDRRCATSVYRFGHIVKPRPQDVRVVLLAQRIAAQLKRKPTLVAWRVGPL